MPRLTCEIEWRADNTRTVHPCVMLSGVLVPGADRDAAGARILPFGPRDHLSHLLVIQAPPGQGRRHVAAYCPFCGTVLNRNASPEDRPYVTIGLRRERQIWIGELLHEVHEIYPSAGVLLRRRRDGKVLRVGPAWTDLGQGVTARVDLSRCSRGQASVLFNIPEGVLVDRAERRAARSEAERA
nr:hypothetical protein [uncultured Roseococcus sp.]